MPIGEEERFRNARRNLDNQIELTKKVTSNLELDVLDSFLYDAATSKGKYHQWGSIFEGTQPGSGDVVPGSPETLLSLVKAPALGLFYAVRAGGKKTHTHNIQNLLTICDIQLILMWAVRPDCGAAGHIAMDVNGRKTNYLTEVLIAETVHASTEVAKADLSFFQVTT